MVTPDQPQEPDGMIQIAAGLADTPLGQKVALTITILLGPDGARSVADAISKVADQMSTSGLIVAAPGTNGAMNGH